MTTTTFDLRQAFAYVGNPAWSGAEEEDGDDTPPPADDATEGDKDTGTTGDEQLSEEEIKNPRMKRLSDEAARHRTNAKAEKDRAEAAEAKATGLEQELRETRMFNAFLVAGFGKLSDVEAAWKLADKAGVTLGEDGSITGMEEVVVKTLERYPYLSAAANEETTPLADKFPALEPSGRPLNAKRRSGDEGIDRKALEKKFPALRRR